jgi:6-phosphogluconolactonase (cycloisomerase 2 family)
MSIRRSTHRILSMAFAAAALVFTGALTGCAGFWQPITTTTMNNTGIGDFVYVGKNSSTTLAGYQIGTGGTLTAIGSGLTVGAAPTSLVISPNNEFLYAGTISGIYAYSISSTGALSALNGGNAIAVFSIAAMDISADGNWLVAITTTPVTGSAGYLYQISSTTGLIVGTGGAQLTAPATGIGQSVQFAPNEAGATVSTIAASFGTAGIYTYTFLTSTTSGGYQAVISQLPVSTLVANASDNGLIWNSAGTAIYFVSGGGSDSTLYSYAVNSTTGVIGTSALGSISTGATGTNPTALSFDSSGTYIYVTNSGTLVTQGSTISGFTVTSSGSSTTFTALSTSPFPTNGTDPSAIINAGSYILAVNQTGPPDLLLYTVDSTTPGRLYVTSSEYTTYNVNNPTTPGSGVSIAATN